MAEKFQTTIPQVLKKSGDSIITQWLQEQAAALPAGTTVDAEASEQSRTFVRTVEQALESATSADINTSEWAKVREVLSEVSRTRAMKGFSPTQTATFVFSLKKPLFDALRAEYSKNSETLAREIITSSALLDKMGLYTSEVYQQSREEVIRRQQEELLELSTPVVQLWEGVLALPLIGTLDSARTQVVMENLLQEIVRTGAAIAIIDITGVPTVDTLVAQHLLKTVAAARLMGADCLISGIRPQIAQTIVHLGVELNVISKANMADAFALALKRIGKVVVDRSKLNGKTKEKNQTAEDQE
jgi:rsbT co-antagonist protein RsbR